MKSRKLKVLITCGPTRESIDPVRFISNYSTGYLGIQLAKAHRKKGDQVSLVHGPIHFKEKVAAKKIPFETTNDLKSILKKQLPKHDVLYMTAAVSDYKPRKTQNAKIKKNGKSLKLNLKQNTDVLQSIRSLKKDKVFVGFAVESKKVKKSAFEKLRKKNLDMIIAQKVDSQTSPFGEKAIDAFLIHRDGTSDFYKKMTKERLSSLLTQKVKRLSDRSS